MGPRWLPSPCFSSPVPRPSPLRPRIVLRTGTSGDCCCDAAAGRFRAATLHCHRGRSSREDRLGAGFRQERHRETTNRYREHALLHCFDLEDHHRHCSHDACRHKQVVPDRPVNTHLRSAKITSPMWDVSQVTLRRLANHTAGLAKYRGLPDYSSQAANVRAMACTGVVSRSLCNIKYCVVQ